MSFRVLRKTTEDKKTIFEIEEHNTLSGDVFFCKILSQKNSLTWYPSGNSMHHKGLISTIEKYLEDL